MEKWQKKVSDQLLTVQHMNNIEDHFSTVASPHLFLERQRRPPKTAAAWLWSSNNNYKVHYYLWVIKER